MVKTNTCSLHWQVCQRYSVGPKFLEPMLSCSYCCYMCVKGIWLSGRAEFFSFSPLSAYFAIIYGSGGVKNLGRGED